MAVITLSSGFKLIPEGRHVFQIVKVEYKEKFGKLNIGLELEDGTKHTERFTLMDKSGNDNTGAIAAFSYFAKTALNDFDLEEVDHEDLIECFISAEAVHTELPSTKTAGETVTFVNLKEYKTADDFDDVTEIVEVKKSKKEKEKAKAKTAPSTTNIDLDDLLG